MKSENKQSDAGPNEILGARVLVVEDEGLVAWVTSNILTELGCEVLGVAASGEEALALAAARRPDLAVMDVHLGSGLDGVETAKRLRRDYDIPCLFVTAYVDEAMRARAQDAEPLGYVPKPYTDADIARSIRQACQRLHLERS